MLDLLLLLLSLPSGVLKSLFAIVVETKVPAPQVSRVAVATHRHMLLSRFLVWMQSSRNRVSL